MNWMCVLCDRVAVEEVEAAPGVDVGICREHLAARLDAQLRRHEASIGPTGFRGGELQPPPHSARTS